MTLLDYARSHRHVMTRIIPVVGGFFPDNDTPFGVSGEEPYKDCNGDINPNTGVWEWDGNGKQLDCNNTTIINILAWEDREAWMDAVKSFYGSVGEQPPKTILRSGRLELDGSGIGST